MIRLKNVCKLGRDGKTLVINNATLNISQGEYVCIQGNSSAAKSVLLKMFAGVVIRDSGEVYLDGVEVAENNFSSLAALRRDKFSCLFLDMDLENGLNVEQNVMLPLIYAGRDDKKKKELTIHSLSILGMQKFAKAKIESLSDWQKNKVLLARCIVTSPRVLIIEEPCRNLDPNKIKEVEGLLSALNQEGITVIIASNQEYYKEKAQVVYAITNGEVALEKRMEVKRQIMAKPQRKPRTKKVKENKISDEGKDVSQDSTIDTTGEVKKIFESQQQLSFGDLTNDVENDSVKEKKKGRVKKDSGEKNNEV